MVMAICGCPWLFLHSAAGLVLLAVLSVPVDVAHAVVPPAIPAAPISDELEKKFPACPPAAEPTIASLHKCEGDLEAYRQGVLEGYNKKIARYLLALVNADKALQLLLSRHQISEDDYNRIHGQIMDGLESAGSNGSLLDPYREYLAKYKEASIEVNQDMRDLLKRRLQTG